MLSANGWMANSVSDEGKLRKWRSAHNRCQMETSSETVFGLRYRWRPSHQWQRRGHGPFLRCRRDFWPVFDVSFCTSACSFLFTQLVLLQVLFKISRRSRLAWMSSWAWQLTNPRLAVSTFAWISTEHGYSRPCRIECGGVLCSLSYAGCPWVESARCFFQLGRNLKEFTRYSSSSGQQVPFEALLPRSLWTAPTQPWHISEVNVQICSYVHPRLDRPCPSRIWTIRSIMRGHWLIAIMRNLWALFFQQRTNRKIRIFLYRKQPPSVNFSTWYIFVHLYVCSPRVYRVGFMKNTLHRSWIIQPPSARVRLWILWKLKLELTPAGSAPE